MVGPTIEAIFAFGVHPSGMKNAVIRPQAMIAAMFGMIIMDRNVPNFWTRTRAPERDAPEAAAVVAVEAMCVFLSRTSDVTHVTTCCPLCTQPGILPSNQTHFRARCLGIGSGKPIMSGPLDPTEKDAQMKALRFY